MDSKDLGQEGERLAKDYLLKNQYKILEENWLYKHKEIDIIALMDNFICIVEVKTRSSNYIPPKEAVTRKKQANLIFAANQYVLEKNLDYDVRFDVIEIILNKKGMKLNHIVDAFVP